MYRSPLTLPFIRLCYRLAIVGLGMMAMAPWSIQAQSTSEATIDRQASAEAVATESRLETVTYQTVYEGKTYEKQATVYVPAGYDASQPLNVFYLMHGSGMKATDFARDMQAYLDQWLAKQPMLVVFPTYYPDESFVVSNYSADYPLNHHFATDEVQTLMETVEASYRTYTQTTQAEDLIASRQHRAFGGYSMGGITTWDVLVEKSAYFAYYMPMAGDSWISRITGDQGADAVANRLMSGLRQGQYGPDDFQIIAMVGENDGTKSSMISQIEALRRTQGDLINDQNLIYWENTRGGHNWDSILAEVEHGLPYLFQTVTDN